MASPLFSVGDLVLIDDKDRAHIIEMNTQTTGNGSILYKVRNVVGNQIQDNIEQHRCKITTSTSSSSTSSQSETNSSSTCNGTKDNSSSLDDSQQPPTSSNADSARLYAKLKQSIKESRTWEPSSSSSIPLMKFLHNNNSKGKGWLRKTLPFKSEKKQLNEQENILILVMASMFTLLSPSTGKALAWVSIMAKAWGVSNKTISRHLVTVVDNDFSCKRKERCDKGVKKGPVSKNKK